MGQNFIACDRDQELLLPPSLREWLPEDHLAWFVVEAVAELDLDAFYGAYRRDGWGAAAHDPQMMVALFVYVLPDPSSRSSHPLAGVSWPLPDVWGGPDRPYPGASGAAGGVDARRWRILSSNPAMSAASTPPPSATIQTFEPSLAGAGVAASQGTKSDSDARPPTSAGRRAMQLVGGHTPK
jgi:hypothetical protein